MQYETYKLGKLKKKSIHRLYTREELEAFELPRLREICRTENIKPPTMEILYHKEELAALLYRYLGIVKTQGITVYERAGCKRLEDAFAKAANNQMGGIEVPARVEVYKDQTSCNDKESPCLAVTEQELGMYAFLVDEARKIQAVLMLKQAETGSYQMRLDRECMSPELPIGRFHQWALLFLESACVEEAVRCYQGTERKKSMISYIHIPLAEVWVKEVPQSLEPLLIDYGTSYTTAGTCSSFRQKRVGAGERISFPAALDCEWRQRAVVRAAISVRVCSR